MITVAVDLDEVLGAFVEALAEFHNAAYGTELTAGSFHSYQFSRVWGGTEEESTAKMHAFFASPFFTGLRPMRGALETLQAHADHCRFFVITSRQHSIEAQTRAWLDTHFPGVFAGVSFGNHWGPQGTSKKSKADMCRDADAALLIDDNPAYATEVVRDAGIAALLFGEYAWNGGHDSPPQPLPARVVRAVSWAHVSELLGRLRVAEKQQLLHPPLSPGGAALEHQQPPLPALIACGRSALGNKVPALAEVEAIEAATGPMSPACAAAWCAAAVIRALESQARVALVCSPAHTVDSAAVLRDATEILLRQGVARVTETRAGSGGGSGAAEEAGGVSFERSPGFLRSRFGAAESLGPPTPAVGSAV